VADLGDDPGSRLCRFSAYHDRMDAFDMHLMLLQPSQLYVCTEKLAAVERLLDETGGVLPEPLPIKRLDGRVVLTDGHTRALAMLRRGVQTVPVCWESDELDWDAYRVCVAWCCEAGVNTVAALEARVIATEQYKVLWLDRCRTMQTRLAEERR
jgi:hypothetical protein